MLGAVSPISFSYSLSFSLIHTNTRTLCSTHSSPCWTINILAHLQFLSLPLSLFLSLCVFLALLSLCPDTLIKGSRRALAQTTGCMLLLINAIKHPAHRGLFIAEMNYLKVQHSTDSFLQLPHYRRRPRLRRSPSRLHGRIQPSIAKQEKWLQLWWAWERDVRFMSHYWFRFC